MSECSSIECSSDWKYWFNLLQKSEDVVLSKAKDYYKNNKDKLREQARDKYRNLSEEEKHKKRENGKNRYHRCLKRRKQD